MSAAPSLAIVTGGASGIGLACVERLVVAGWRVAAFDRDAGAIDAARARPGNAEVRFEAIDITDEAAVERAVAAAAEASGPLAGLVNSAGVGRDTPFFDTTAEMFRRIHEVNVIGTFVVAKAAARRMREAGGGAIVNIASVSGQVGNIGRAAYGSSKGAVINLTRVMAVELARYGIRVNAVAPGPVETPMVAAVHTEAVRAEWNERVPLGRYGAPAEIAEAVEFLVDGRRSAYVTGQILAVDGGFTAVGLMGRDRGDVS